MIGECGGPWRLRPGEYLGEISALCFLHLPPHISSLPLLLAGTGSQIQVHDLATGKIIRSFQVFEGVRVHGISLENFYEKSEGNVMDFLVAVYGERRVKIFILKVELNGHELILNLELASGKSIPMFGQWVLDVGFLKEDASSTEGAYYLAIGCSDNSLHFWNILGHFMFSQVKCSERCLLYAMKMFGNRIESLYIASGTIFNEIIVWKVVSRNHGATIEAYSGDSVMLTKHESLRHPARIYEDVLINRLVGHEGSIFRIAWLSSGRKLISVSDDRSARLWEIQAEQEVNHMTGSSVLFGHAARIWDCCIFDSLIITAGEDCTCRIWNQKGQEINEIKEHIGRGIWRCLYDPITLLLVTAGFDSAIRVRQLSRSLNGSLSGLASRCSSNREEVFALSLPTYSRHDGLLDSKSEYIRCLHLSNQESLYVATNNGYLYHASLVKSNDVIWTKLGHIGTDSAIICMDLSTSDNQSGGNGNWVALGDGKGNLKIIKVVGTSRCPEVEFSFSWQAERERNLLSCFWCNSLRQRFVLTANPSGNLKLWKICYDSPSSQINGTRDVLLVGEFVSCFGMRIMCVDVSYDEELVVCGDIRGNLLLFSLPKHLICGSATAAEAKASPACYFRAAHGVSTVNSVSISSLSSHQVQIRTTGTDGCICYLQYNKHLRNLEFVGMTQVKDLSAVQSVYNLSTGSYAVGFASAYFMIWNSTTATKVLQIPCGGWRRPNSYYVGGTPEIMNCFSFVKDDVIYIHRNWLHQNDLQLYPRNSHFQFHGREIHSLCFISGQSLFNADDNQGLVSESCFVSTGCEDGTVRLTRYELGMHKWLSSELLGEHVGGSAVRSLCSVSAIHTFFSEPMAVPGIVCEENDISDTALLISVGAKRVVTAWKQIYAILHGKVDGVASETGKDQNKLTGSCSAVKSSFSFQWLSTDMPAIDSVHRSRKKADEIPVEAYGPSLLSEGRNMELDVDPESTFDDYRHLAVTAFLVKEAVLRISVCFVVIASSDATVTVRALVLPFRLWFDVATLSSSSSPVLTVQHVVFPKLPNLKGNTQAGNIYLVITGSTDGSIAIWDLTSIIETFMMHVSDLPLENCPGVQKRPRTGRGSQGGRLRRALGRHSAKTKPTDCNIRQQQEQSDIAVDNHESGSHHVGIQGNLDSLRSKYSFPEPVCLEALHVLENAHQSGVNSLYVSDFLDSGPSEPMLSFFIVSGGDDQAINCLKCDISGSPQAVDDNLKAFCQIRNFTCMDKAPSAHSSAVKGVWTDGIFVFSVGLDQRLRCWSLSGDKLVERAHIIVSVPEPEALDVKSTGRNKYQIAVAGRGIQMIEFSPASDELCASFRDPTGDSCASGSDQGK